MPKALFFSCEPGGAEVLIPVIRYLQQNSDFSLTVLGYGHGGQRFSANGISYHDIQPVSKLRDLYLEEYDPDVLITSATSLPQCDMSEKYLWHHAGVKGIASIAFVDQWQNYLPRFSGVREDEALSYMPDIINCINSVGYQEMVQEGFPPERLISMGQPYLSNIVALAEDVDEKFVKQRLEIDEGSKVALFISEAIAENYGNSRGYDQYKAFDMFLSAVEECGGEYVPVVKLHPKDAKDKFLDILDSHTSVRPIFVASELPPIQVLKISDIVVGMTSTMLIEAYMIGCPLISLQPNLNVDDPLVLSRYKLIPLFSESSGFSLDLVAVPEVGRGIDVEFRPERFMSVMRDLMLRQ